MFVVLTKTEWIAEKRGDIYVLWEEIWWNIWESFPIAILRFIRTASLGF